MSTLKLNGVTSGSSIIKAPDSGSTGVTFTLPASTGTLLTTTGSAANLTAIPAANITGTLPAISGANLTAIPAANITGTLPAISGANLTGIVSIPVGTEVLWATGTAPSGWLEEDGAAISRSTYSALYAVIGTTYGVGDGSTTFNLPDARGEFIRGWAHGSASDPDRAARTNRGDGTTGDSVGTKQGYGIHDHKHEVGPTTYGGTGSVNYVGLVPWAAGEAGYGGGDMRSTSTSDTRPRNVTRMILIKY